MALDAAVGWADWQVSVRLQASSGGKCTDNVRADNSLVDWTMPSSGSGSVGVKITYAGGENRRQKICH